MHGDYLKQLIEARPVSAEKPYPAYGLGQGMRPTDFGMAYGHSGWIPGYTSFMVYFADHRIAIAAQFNVSPDAEAGPTPVDLAKKRLPLAIIEAIRK